MDPLKNRFPYVPERIEGLGQLAYNLWWSWNPAARMLFKTLDRQAWKDSVHNPVRMLREMPRDILDAASLNTAYLIRYDEVMSAFREEIMRASSAGTLPYAPLACLFPWCRS